LDIGETKTIRIILSWYVPFSELSHGKNKNLDLKKECYRPWYAEKFKDIYEIVEYSKNNYESLHKKSESFAKSLNSLALPHEILEAVSANLSILKSSTVLRQKDGRFWAWEGCFDNGGSCYGSCTHVWNYAQALPHLFPDLERNLRITEFFDSQNEIGHQNFRTSLPIGEADHSFHAAADGQLGGIMKVYREWKISKNTEWLRNIWPQVKQSLNYSINIWDPQKIGILTAPHHNTYDIEFWGPNGMCTSIYLGALKAASLMANELKEDGTEYFHLYRLGRIKMEKELWNGEYFFHKIQINEKLENENTSIVILPNSSIIEKKTSQIIPKYQYGEGCLADGVIGAWFAEVCQVGEILDPIKVKSHLESVYRYNFKKSFHDHANPQRPTYALKDESGILLCTWPKGGRLQFPFPYSEEVWTGIEYQIASHLAFMGENEKCLEIVKAVRSRYNGIRRNPYSEFECGQWYGRALSSYSLLQAFGIKPNFWK
jgi:uncharacterized protein (DUF608 family)